MTDTHILPTLWTIDEVAEYLHVPQGVALNLMNEAGIQFLDLGHGSLVIAEDLARWVHSKVQQEGPRAMPVANPVVPAAPLNGMVPPPPAPETPSDEDHEAGIDAIGGSELFGGQQGLGPDSMPGGNLEDFENPYVNAMREWEVDEIDENCVMWGNQLRHEGWTERDLQLLQKAMEAKKPRAWKRHIKAAITDIQQRRRTLQQLREYQQQRQG